jgi:hypothetical protein
MTNLSTNNNTMILSKQDIEKIAKRLAMLGAKDSQFPELRNIDDSVQVPILSGGRNMTTKLSDVQSYILGNADLSQVPLSMTGIDATNLLDVLYAIKVLAETKTTIDGKNLTATSITTDPYTIPSGDRISNLQELLLYILDEINVLNGKFAVAENEDINSIFTVNQ